MGCFRPHELVSPKFEKSVTLQGKKECAFLQGTKERFSFAQEYDNLQ